MYPDGHTNQPTPEAVRQNPQQQVQQVFDLAIDRAQLGHGELVVNDSRIPFDLGAQQVRAQMTYLQNQHEYSLALAVGGINARYRGSQAFASSLEAQLNLLPGEVVLKSFAWSGGQSQLQASGRLVDFRKPEITLDYQGTFDLAHLGEVAHLPELRRGVLQLSGSGRYSAGEFSTSGKAMVKSAAWEEASLHVSSVTLGAEFSIGDRDLQVSHLFGTLFGGSVTGSAEVKNWRNLQQAEKPAERGSEQQGAAHFQFRKVLVRQMAAAISSPSLPLNRLNPAGIGDGSVEVRWSGSPERATSEFALNVAPGEAGEAGPALPLSGKTSGSYSMAGGRLTLAQFDMSGRSLDLSATGTIGQGTSNLKVSVTAGDLNDVAPLLAVFWPQQKFPPGVSGHASFLGTISGPLAQPAVAGHLQASEVRLGLPLPGLPALPAGSQASRTASVDQFEADIQYSAQALSVVNGSLRAGSQSASFQGSAGLFRGAFTDASPITASLAIRNGLLDHLQALVGYSYPIAGVLNASTRLTGTRGNPAGTATVHVTKAQAYGEPIDTLDASLRLENHQVNASDSVLAYRGAHVSGEAAYNLQNSNFQFKLSGSNLELARVQQLQTARTAVGGQVDFVAGGSGTLQKPAINADLRIRELAFNGERFGAMTVLAQTVDETLRISARSGFAVSQINADGAISLGGDFPGSLEVRFIRLDVDWLLHQFQRGRLTGHSAATGVVTAQGPFRHPSLLALNATVDQLTAQLEQVELRNSGPLRLTMAGGTLRVEQFRMVGQETEVTASGSMQVAGRQELDLRAAGHINLVLLQTFNPAIHSAGTVTFQLDIGGMASRPALRGEVQIADGAISYIDLPNGLSSVNGKLVFNLDRLQVQELTAQTGGGTVTFGGFVNYGTGLTFNVTAQGRDIRLRYPQGISSTIRADLTLTGSTANALLAGDVTILKLGTSPQFDLADYLAQAKKVPTPPNPRSPLNKLRFDVHLASTPELEVQTSLARFSGDVDLRLRGTAAHPVILGRINTTEGQIAFNGTNYQVERGDISFTNPTTITPILDVELTTRVRDYDVSLGFHGDLNHLSTTYRSEPPLPTSDIIALLAFGQTREESATITEPNPSFSESASNAILSQALNATFSNRVQRLFGVSHFKIAPDVGGPGVAPAAQVTIEQQVSKNITLTYITSLTQAQQQTIQMEYNINRNLSIVALRDQNGVVSFDVRVRRRKR